ncbi:MAG: histidinol-phosphatase [Clostridiales bacterium 43-6]|nr:MAG: histidinol-phosphatase [Clostridiales bacterium 43-6]
MDLGGSPLEQTYRYETHLHTSEASACATASGAEMVHLYMDAGYAGIIITDHFFNGNTCIDRSLPWEEKINLFSLGYENAFKEAEGTDFKVFFGWEYSYHGTEFLTYGLDKQFLLSHPELLDIGVLEYLDLVHENGGFISHAHPYREAPYIAEIRLYPHKVDAVEVINASHQEPSYNEKALAYAEQHSLLKTSGSDTHHTHWLCGGGMVFPFPLFTIEDFIRAVKENKTIALLGS